MIYLYSVEALYKHIRKSGLFNCAYSNLILIGGCARSGKSTITARLVEEITTNGVGSCIVKIDSWLVSSEKRNSVSTVIDRYECKKIIESIKKILKGGVVHPPVYDVNSRRRIAEYGEDSIFIKKGVIIVEGVIALSLEKLLDIAYLKIFVRVSDKIRLQRLKYFYNKIKGLDMTETMSIIRSREIEEVPFIKKTAKYADIILET